MENFFKYTSPYRENDYIDMSFLERVLPIVFLVFLIFLVIYFRETFRNNMKADVAARVTMGLVLSFFYIMDFILRFLTYGFDFYILPFQLCSFTMILAVILTFTRNKKVFPLVLFAGLLGGVMSLAMPVLGYNSKFFRYYQFMIAHSVLTLIPIYFVVVHKYLPTFKDLKSSYLIAYLTSLFMVVFNTVFDTEYFFLITNQSKVEKFPQVNYLGGIPYYIVGVQALGFLFFLAIYYIVNVIYGKEGELEYQDLSYQEKYKNS